MASVFTEDFTAEDLIAEAEELGVTPGKLKLIKAVQLVDEELLTEDAIDMSVKDLMAIIRAHHQEYRALMTEERINARIALREQLMEEHQLALEEHVRANEDLTEEQIEAILERIQERSNIRNERWEERKQAWEDRMNDQGMPPYNNQEEDNQDNPS
jgi:regulator of RNase E activity RraB